MFGTMFTTIDICHLLKRLARLTRNMTGISRKYYLLFVFVVAALAITLLLSVGALSSPLYLSNRQDSSKSKKVIDAIRILRNSPIEEDNGGFPPIPNIFFKNTTIFAANGPTNEKKSDKDNNNFTNVTNSSREDTFLGINMTDTKEANLNRTVGNGRLLFNIDTNNTKQNSCNPVFPQVVLYNRIFKTGSTSMSDFLRKCSKILKYHVFLDYTEDWSNENSSYPILTDIEQLAKQLKQKQRLLAVAHFFFRQKLTMSGNYTYINVLREPVRRFISHYYYVRNPTRWAERLEALKKRGHFNDTIEECLDKQHEGCTWNTMTRFFCGPEAMCKTGSREALGRAKYNMAHYYTSVGVLENLADFIHVLSKRLPGFVVNKSDLLHKQFVTKGVRKKRITKSVMEKIVHANEADIELYNFAKTLFHRQARQCGVEINS